MANTKLGTPYDHHDSDLHPVWDHVFSPLQKERQIDDDMSAGLLIPAILMGVMLFGFLSMVFSVWLSL